MPIENINKIFKINVCILSWYFLYNLNTLNIRGHDYDRNEFQINIIFSPQTILANNNTRLTTEANKNQI